MKKLITLLLALVMVMSLSVTAFADSVQMGVNGGSSSREVYVKLVEGVTAPKVYSVVVEWQLTDGIANKAASYTWDPDQLKYTATGAADYSHDPAVMTIGIENRSNSQIQYKLKCDHEMSNILELITVTSGNETWEQNGSEPVVYYKGYDYRLPIASAAPADYSTNAQTSAPKDTVNIKFNYAADKIIDAVGDGWFSVDTNNRAKIGTIVIDIYPA